MNLSREEKLEIIKIEISLLQSWFDKYDEIIFRARCLLATGFIAVLGFMINKNMFQLTKLLIGVDIFFYLFEILWLYRYWTRRTLRYQLIQYTLNKTPENIIKIPIFDPTYSRGKNNTRSKRLKIWIKKCDEPSLFYASLIVGVLLVRCLF